MSVPRCWQGGCRAASVRRGQGCPKPDTAGGFDFFRRSEHRDPSQQSPGSRFGSAGFQSKRGSDQRRQPEETGTMGSRITQRSQQLLHETQKILHVCVCVCVCVRSEAISNSLPSRGKRELKRNWKPRPAADGAPRGEKLQTREIKGN